MKVMVPEIVFDPYHKLRIKQRDEFLRFVVGWFGQIEDEVGTFVTFHHLISGRREEGDHNAVAGINFPDPFYQVAPLFKFAEGRTVHPYYRPGIGVQGLANVFKEIFSSLKPETGFGVP
jgi:hypothetical protein